MQATMSRHLDDTLEALAPVRKQLMDHAMYQSIKSIDDLRIFMAHHVFAVWDFMSLLKTLQKHLTCVSVPWLPPEHAVAARLVNEIVLAEESDSLGNGEYISHYDLYLAAMRQTGADTRPIESLIRMVKQKTPIKVALAECPVPQGVRRFVQSNFDVIDTGKLWMVASAFTFGREEIIPDMFRHFDLKAAGNGSDSLSILRQYLELHIITDEHHHVPLAFRLMRALCKEDPVKWAEVHEAARNAIQARIALWDSVIEAIKARQHAYA
jgi:hypothetical protein